MTATAARPAYPIRSAHIPEDVTRLAARLDARPELARGGVAVDLGAVDDIGSRDLGCLIRLHTRARGGGGRLALVNVRPAVRDLLAVTHLDTLFAVQQD